jgi:anti-anti-sigma factor
MEITFSFTNGIGMARMAGELDLYSSPDACTLLLSQIRTAPGKRLIVDLGEVPYIDSSGIGVLITAFAQARKLGVAICFANPTEEIQRVVRLTSLNGFLPIEESIRDAEKCLAAGRGTHGN